MLCVQYAKVLKNVLKEKFKNVIISTLVIWFVYFSKVFRKHQFKVLGHSIFQTKPTLKIFEIRLLQNFGYGFANSFQVHSNRHQVGLGLHTVNIKRVFPFMLLFWLFKIYFCLSISIIYRS